MDEIGVESNARYECSVQWRVTIHSLINEVLFTLYYVSAHESFSFFMLTLD